MVFYKRSGSFLSTFLNEVLTPLCVCVSSCAYAFIYIHLYVDIWLWGPKFRSLLANQVLQL